MNLMLALWRRIPGRPHCRTGHHLLLCRLAAPYIDDSCRWQ